MQKRRTASVWISVGLASGLAATVLTDAVFNKMLSREGVLRQAANGNAGMNEVRARYGDAAQKGAAFIRSTPHESVAVKASADGVTLHGHYYRARDPKRIVLMAHGYAGSPGSFCGIAEWLFGQGSDMLMIDQRASGESGGEWSTFGALEQYDLLDWLSWIHDRNDKDLPVYLYGTSMGGASVLMASGHDLPGDVAGVIADSAYTSMKDIVLESVRRRIRFIPVRLAIKVIESCCIGKAGFDLNGADAEKALRNCRTPVLLIHGTADRRVLADNSRRNHQACACADKELLIVENADHVCSWFEDPDRYRSTLAAFFEKHDRHGNAGV